MKIHVFHKWGEWLHARYPECVTHVMGSLYNRETKGSGGGVLLSFDHRVCKKCHLIQFKSKSAYEIE